MYRAVNAMYSICYFYVWHLSNIRYSPSASLHSRVLDMRALEILLALELRVEVLTFEMKTMRRQEIFSDKETSLTSIHPNCTTYFVH